MLRHKHTTVFEDFAYSHEVVFCAGLMPRSTRRAGHSIAVVTWLVVAMMLASVAEASPMAVAAPYGVGLYPGMEIDFQGGGRCSLGFIATNRWGARLGVTAGHCSNAVGQHVLSHNRYPIGVVLARADDALAAGRFGVTVIQLVNSAYIYNGFFARFRSPELGEPVRKYGERTEGTNGRITSVYDGDDPTRSVMRSTVVALPGDSGAPWYRSSESGPVLFGITVGNSTRRQDDAYVGGFGFPINSLIRYVRNGSKWGDGFIPVGRSGM